MKQKTVTLAEYRQLARQYKWRRATPRSLPRGGDEVACVMKTDTTRLVALYVASYDWKASMLDSYVVTYYRKFDLPRKRLV
jgi:hypothetical protein